MRLVYWGTYDLGKPRNRILMRGLRENGVQVVECHKDIWSQIEDKSQIVGKARWAGLFLRWVLSYPMLVLRYCCLPRHDAVVIGYMGQLDVLVLWPFARIRGVPIIWDFLMSLYLATVVDRKLFGPRHPLAVLLYVWEWLAFRAADLSIVVTKAGACKLKKLYRLQTNRVVSVFIGVEPECFPGRPTPDNPPGPQDPIKVLFYGTFIPLHGVETIIQAALMMADQPVDWTLIGKGQEAPKIRCLLKNQPIQRLTWIEWVPYTDLAKWIHRADICLGMFGSSERADLVIGNKIFQIVASGTPLITRDSTAIREFLEPEMPGIFLVPPSDPGALVKAIQQYRRQRSSLCQQRLHRKLLEKILPCEIGREVMTLITFEIDKRSRKYKF